MRQALDTSNLELNETIVSIRRVAKTVKGGRNMRFSVTVVVGDGEGHVGVGLGKAQEIPEAVRKATEDAKKNVILVPTVGTTIPHRQLGVFGAGRVTDSWAYSEQEEYCSCRLPLVQALSQVHPFVQYWKPQASRTSERSPLAPTTPATWLTQQWKA